MQLGRLHVYIITVISFLSLTSFSSSYCGKKRIMIDNTNALFSLKEKDCHYTICGVVDLNGGSIRIPSGCILDFQRGSIINGSVLGRATQLKGLHRDCIGFKAEGTWLVSKINDSYYDTNYLSDNQIMSNISLMQSNDIHNKIFINKDQYSCSIKKDGGYVLNVSSNSKLYLNTTISIEGNNFIKYSIIRVAKKENVFIKGGTVIGDVGLHEYVAGSTSQWGHGILINNSKHVRVENTSVMKCIGDGFTITGGSGQHTGDMSMASRDIVLSHVTAKFNRRQGLSIIHADNVVVKNSVFSDTGTIESQSPSSGIDIEPNLEPHNQTTRNIKIISCKFERNVGRSILSNHYVNYEGEKSVSSVLIDGCYCDGKIELYTGGIQIRNSSFASLEVYAEKDPIDGLSFTRCSIGEKGISINCKNRKNGEVTGIDGIMFNRCRIVLPDNLPDRNEENPAMLGGNKENIKGVVFNSCKITTNK